MLLQLLRLFADSTIGASSVGDTTLLLSTLHTFANFAIADSYFVISATLVFFYWKVRQDLPFNWVLLAFGAFIVTFAGTHVVHVMIDDNPGALANPVLRWSSVAIHAACVLSAGVTALALPFVVPKAIGTLTEARISDERRRQLETAHGESETLYGNLKQIDELKSRFFANVSHELRMPLALVIGPTQHLLETRSITPEQRELLEVVARNARTVLDGVNDLLDIAQLDAGTMILAYSEVDVGEIVRTSAAHFDRVARGWQARYVVDADPATAQVDVAKFQRIVLNLLANSFQCVPFGGTVQISVGVRGPLLRITVEDSGPSIPAHERELVFGRFQTTDWPKGDQIGSGLRLAVVAEFARIHGGTASVEDSPLGGARFVVELPSRAPLGALVDRAAVTPRPDPSFEPVLASRHPVRDLSEITGSGQALILVVEDDPEMRRYLAGLLGADHRVAVATDGRDGLQRATELHPDLIVSDLMMPEMDGEEMLAALRAGPETAEVSVILLSSRPEQEVRERLMGEGAQDYMVKPFSDGRLRTRIAELLQAKLARDVLRRAVEGQERDLLRLAEELSERNRDLRRAVAARDDFLSSAAHELKTPVATLVLQAESLARRARRDPAAPLDLSQAEAILTEVGKLNSLIVELMDITRAEQGRLVGPKLPVNLTELIHEVCEPRTSPLHRFVVNVATRVEGRFDQVRVKQLLANLLENAVKYSPGGGDIGISAYRTDGHVRIEVSDHGIGVPTTDLPRIFDRLQRGSNVDDRTFVGMGLGLFFCRAIVEEHGGRIWATSPGPNLGTTLHVELPAFADSP